MILAARQKFLFIPDELGDRVAGCSDPVKCCLMIENKIHAALDELAEYPSAKKATAPLKA